MDPPAGFVHSWNPAVAAPRSPVSPEGAYFRAAHHPECFGSHRPTAAPAFLVSGAPQFVPKKCLWTSTGTGRC